MNVGEKIQIFRKSKGMSQEDLAQRLLVSRQTVSLWETGKTLPTIDNLICLKNVFGMTLDDILCTDHKEENRGDSFVFCLTAEERRQMLRAVFAKKLFMRINLSFIAAILAASAFFIFGAELVFGILGGVFLCSLLPVSEAVLWHGKAKKELSEQPDVFTYRYSVSNENAVIDLSGCPWGSESVKIKLDKIEKLLEFDGCFCFELGGKFYPVSKEMANKYFSGARKINASNTAKGAAARLENAISFYLSSASAVCVVLSLLEIFRIAATDEFYKDATYVFFLFGAIPLTQIVYGTVRCFLKKRGAMNIIIGALFLAVFCFYGSIGLIFRA
ncbi:MAG: helix-turn-helix transcriptional regulator [Clostridia bacterium]|nr:helix-turn-helix transcriptional regulator [Clostridia bacterium]